MQAAVFDRYGPPEVLRLSQVTKPVPADNEVLVRIHASTVTAGDCRMRRADPFAARLYNGIDRPRRVQMLGMELAGEIVETGSGVTLFRSGDRVFGSPGFRFGAYAQYICLPENAVLAVMPEDLSYEEAAAVPGGAFTALLYLRRANIQAGQKVLIYGASGSVGSYAVQLASAFGAQVDAICSGVNVELVRSLGADRVFDYTREDFTRSGKSYDVIFDAVGKAEFSHCKHSLVPQGVFLTDSTGPGGILQMMWTSLTGGKKFVHITSSDTSHWLASLVELRGLIEAGKLRPVIDRTYPLEQIVEAHRYVDLGHKKGNVVVRVRHTGNH